MFIPDPDFFPSRIQDQATKKRGKFFVLHILEAINFKKFVNYFIFKEAPKLLTNWQRFKNKF
jgi:hypothetical protein